MRIPSDLPRFRRRSFLRAIAGPLMMMLVALLIFALILWWQSNKSDECEAKGGVYLRQEYKCVRGIEEVE